MPTYNRNDIKRGRGLVQVGSTNIFVRGDLTLRWGQSTFDIQTQGRQRDKRANDRFVIAQFQPVGVISTALLALYYPHLSKAFGAKALTSSDVAWKFYFEADDELFTVHNCVVFKQPDLNLALGQSPFGQMTVHGLVRNEMEANEDNAFYTRSTSSFPGDTGYSAANDKAGLFTGAWGETSPWDELHSENGFRVSVNAQLTKDGPDSFTRDYKVGNQSITVQAVPKGISIDNLADKLEPKYQGEDAALGCDSVLANADDLDISNDDLYVRLYNADFSTGGVVADPNTDVVESLTWENKRTSTSGDDDPVLYVGTSAPA
jgi:hypothetical protein